MMFCWLIHIKCTKNKTVEVEVKRVERGRERAKDLLLYEIVYDKMKKFNLPRSSFSQSFLFLIGGYVDEMKEMSGEQLNGYSDGYLNAFWFFQ